MVFISLMKNFRRRVVRCQRFVKSVIACKKARLQALSICWQKVEKQLYQEWRIRMKRQSQAQIKEDSGNYVDFSAKLSVDRRNAVITQYLRRCHNVYRDELYEFSNHLAKRV